MSLTEKGGEESRSLKPEGVEPISRLGCKETHLFVVVCFLCCLLCISEKVFLAKEDIKTLWGVTSVSILFDLRS